MKLISKYTLMEVATPAALALVVVGFLAVAVELREKVRELPVDMAYLTGLDVLRLFLYFLPTLVMYVVPITYMMGVLLGFGRLAQNNEITAMKAAGIPLKRVVVPVIACGVLLSVFSFLLQDRVQPFALRKANELIYSELPLRVSLDMLPTGRMHPFGKWRVYIGHRDSKTRTLRNVEILQPQPDGSIWAYLARSAHLAERAGKRIVVLKDCRVIPQQQGESSMCITMEEVELSLFEMSKEKASGLRKTLPLTQLLKHEKDLEARYAEAKIRDTKRDLMKTRWEVSERIALPASCLAVCLLAAPLAVRGRRGGRSYSFAIGFIIILAYQVMRILIEPSSLESLTENILRGMAPNLLLGLLGVAALWRVDRV